MAQYRACSRRLEVDTLHGRLRYHPSRKECSPNLFADCEILVVEEFGQVSEELGRVLMNCWTGLDHSFLILFVGDHLQLEPVSGKPLHLSPLWATHVHERRLLQLNRCLDPDLHRWLEHLRGNSVSRRQLRDLLRCRKRGNPVPTKHDLLAVLRERADTTFVTYTLKAAHWINTAVVDMLFDAHSSLGEALGSP